MHITQKPDCGHLHRPRALILLVPEGRVVGACPETKPASPAGGSAAPIPAEPKGALQKAEKGLFTRTCIDRTRGKGFRLKEDDGFRY